MTLNEVVQQAIRDLGTVDGQASVSEYTKTYPYMAVLETEMTSRVYQVLESVVGGSPDFPSQHVHMRPFLPDRQDIDGILWAGVPSLTCSGESEGGALIFHQFYEGPPESPIGPVALRIMPGLQETDLAFVPMRCNRLREVMQIRGGHQLDDPPEQFPIGYNRACQPRVDHIAAAIMALGTHPGTPGIAFRGLLGDTPIAVFARSLWENLYRDKGPLSLQTVGSRFAHAAKMVLAYAYPTMMSHPTLEDLKCIRQTLRHPLWSLEEAWPTYYNLVVPPSLFQAARECMTQGHTPIIPQYITSTVWLFNGGRDNYCLGTDPNPGNSWWAKKVWAGMHSGFNLDISGEFSKWPGPIPAEWATLLVQAMQDQQEETPHLRASQQTDAGLEKARNVPCMFRCVDSSYVTSLIYNLVDASGEVQCCDGNGVPQEVPPCSDPPSNPFEREDDEENEDDVCAECRGSFDDYTVCGNCHEIICSDCHSRPEGHGECRFCPCCRDDTDPHYRVDMAPCHLCGRLICSDHYDHCESCLHYICSACESAGDHACSPCERCGGLSDTLGTCERCGTEGLCATCREGCCLLTQADTEG